MMSRQNLTATDQPLQDCYLTQLRTVTAPVLPVPGTTTATEAKIRFYRKM